MDLAQVSIRACEPGDAERVFRIYAESYSEIIPSKSFDEMVEHDRRAYGEDYAFLSVENLRRWLSSRREGRFLDVAVVEGRIVGFVKYSVFERSGQRLGYVEEIHVCRDFRGRGIGSALLLHAEKALSMSKAVGVYVEARRGVEGFFIRHGYFPLDWEPRPYMGVLEYLDMFKPLEIAGAMDVFARHVVRGNYRDAADLLKKILGLLLSLGVKRRGYVEGLYEYLRFTAEDIETQDYYPLIERIEDAAKRLGAPFRSLLLSLAYEIRGDSETYLQNHGRAASSFREGARLACEALKMFVDDGVFTHEPLSCIIDLIKCKEVYYQVHCVRSMLHGGRASDSVNCLLEDSCMEMSVGTDFGVERVLEELEERVANCKGFEDVLHYVRHSIKEISSMNKMSVSGSERSEVFSGRMVFLDFFYLGGTVDLMVLGEKLSRIKAQGGAGVFSRMVKLVKDYRYVSEDIVGEDVLGRIYDNIMIEFGHVGVEAYVHDERVALDIVPRIVIFSNGYGIIELETSFRELSPLALTIISKLYDESMPEVHIFFETGERVEKINKFAREELLEPLLDIMGDDVKGRIIMPSNATFYTIIVVSNVMPEPGISKPDDFISRYPEIYLLVNPQTTLFSETYYGEFMNHAQKAGSHNLASKIGLTRAYISANVRYALFIVPYEESWYVEELTSICKLVGLARFVAFSVSQHINAIFDKLSGTQGLDYKETIDIINRAKSHYINNTWLFQSLTTCTYPEYQNFMNTVVEKIGITEMLRLLSQKMDVLDKTLDIQLNRLNLDMARASSQQQAAIDLLTALISSFTLGDIIFSILSSGNIGEQVLRIAIYSAMMLLILAIIRYMSGSRK